MGKKFSCVWKFDMNESQLGIKTTRSRTVCMYVSFVLVKYHTTIRISHDNWRWISIRGDRNLSTHFQGLMRFKNSFSLYLKRKRAFFLILFVKYLSQSSQFEQQKHFFFLHFLEKFTYHDTLTMVETNLRLPVFELMLGDSCTDLSHLCKCHTGMKCGSLCIMECTGGLCSLTMTKYKRWIQQEILSLNQRMKSTLQTIL